MWDAAVPDLQFSIEDIVAEGSRVVARFRFKGTHTCQFKGGHFRAVKPSGKAIDATEMVFAKIENGKILELWEDYDEAGVMAQLGCKFVIAL